MITLPHLPAPSAIYDPFNGETARAARAAAQRGGAQELAANQGGGRLRRDPLRPELADPVDRLAEERQSKSRSHRDATAVFGRAATNLYFVQRFAQEEDLLDRPGVAHGKAAAAYPSLAFDDDILLPGEVIPLGGPDQPRLDIIV